MHRHPNKPTLADSFHCASAGAMTVGGAEGAVLESAGGGVMQWDPAENSVAEALFVRLCRAIENNETFRVCIVIPIHPDGPIRTMRAIQLVYYWQSCTISRGGFSLLERWVPRRRLLCRRRVIR